MAPRTDSASSSRAIGLSPSVRHLVERQLSATGSEPVDSDTPGELADPGLKRAGIAQRLELLERARKHLLEDILGVVLREAEGARRDRENVAGVRLDEFGPGSVVAIEATPDQP